MNKPHKHCELIKAWADGATIEFFHPETRKWVVDHMPTWSLIVIYRIKLEPEKRHVRLCVESDGRVISVCTKCKSRFPDNDYNWVSDWVEVELYSESE